MGEVGLVANRHAYTALMYGLFRKGVKKGEFELREEISRSSVIPNLIINEYCNDVRTSRASSLLDERKVVVCNVGRCNTSIGGLCREMRIWEAELLVDQITRVVVSPNLITYNMLIYGVCKVGEGLDFLHLIR